MSDISQEYLSVGGNRQTAASAWCSSLGCLAYGSDQNIALWRPLNATQRGVHRILQGHVDKVTALGFGELDRRPILASGAANGDLILWRLSGDGDSAVLLTKANAHLGSLNTIANLPGAGYIVTGGADATFSVWKLENDGVRLCVSLKPKPRLIPLALAAGVLPDLPPEHGFFLAAAGTRNDIQIYAIRDLIKAPGATLACSLTGHEGWIRSLALRSVADGGYLMASTSHDKYVRLWRLTPGHPVPRQNGKVHEEVASLDQTLTAKVQSVGFEGSRLSITFEALLLGHEDWIYSADWQSTEEQKLLTASADGTLAIWEPDPTSGIWVSETRLGEISGQKGATTATGSSGGFWRGLWISNQDTLAVVSLGRTGSWRMWHYDQNINYWTLHPGVGGHIGSVNGLCWPPSGSYLLSTSSDQTTRLHAEWKRDGHKTWHEFSRCQIHGYDCNVVASIDEHQFASGADEKLLRVFNEPKDLAAALHRLCDIEPPKEAHLPETAAIPVLGLSNKEMGEPDDIIEAGPRRGDDEYAAANAMAGISVKNITEPPTEDLLSRHTLWPELEKLYGHGYEISEAAYSDGILATACKASSIDHATIRLYDTRNDWREIKPPLVAHSLTVTRLAWSRGSEQLLLSVGRDRQWTIFQRQPNTSKLGLLQSMPKAHTRMILDAAWSPSREHLFFATAGRDKTVKLWGLDTGSTGEDSSAKVAAGFKLRQSISRSSPVTAIDMTGDTDGRHALLAVGEDGGLVSIHVLDLEDQAVKKSIDLEREVCPSKTVNRLAWRPAQAPSEKHESEVQLAVASADGSVRILRVDKWVFRRDET